MEAVLGIDVGGTSIKAGLFTPEVLMTEDVKVRECFNLSHKITEGN